MISFAEPRSLAEQVLDAMHLAIGANIAVLHEPSFHGNEWLYVKECLDSTFVSSVGAFVDRFESDLAQFTGAKHAVAVVNGTAALHIALLLAGVQSNDEVLIPALTFVATANAVAYCNATPHFVDSEERTLGLDSIKLYSYLARHTERHSGQCVNRATQKIIRALVPMHTFGHPVDIEGMLKVAHDFNLILVEDAAESLGSYYQGQHTGTFGKLGTLSFNGNKTITTGGGGAILTDDYALALRAKHLTTTAKVPHPWEYIHDEVGYNYRLPNINAALGCAQLEQLPSMLVNKRMLFERYRVRFSGLKGVKLIEEPTDCSSNYWLQTLLFTTDQKEQRNLLLKLSNEAGLATRPAWGLLSSLRPFRNTPRMDLSMAASISERLVNLPSSSILVDSSVPCGS